MSLTEVLRAMNSRRGRLDAWETPLFLSTYYPARNRAQHTNKVSGERNWCFNFFADRKLSRIICSRPAVIYECWFDTAAVESHSLNPFVMDRYLRLSRPFLPNEMLAILAYSIPDAPTVTEVVAVLVLFQQPFSAFYEHHSVIFLVKSSVFFSG